tara:strand:- start:98 stop:319 length:222 start_codon:yes stop_codon:yes gene_type:complete
MTKLISYTPTGCDMPVAQVSPNTPDWVLNTIDGCWDKVSSGFGDHMTVEELSSIQRQEELDEYNEEYGQANAW